MNVSRQQQDGRLPVREIFADSLLFWEWRRIFFNIVLATVLLMDLALLWPSSREALQPGGLATLLLHVVLANAAYCAGYLVDFLFQFSDCREPWRRWRIVVWLAATAIAALTAHILTVEAYGTPSIDSEHFTQPPPPPPPQSDD